MPALREDLDKGSPRVLPLVLNRPDRNPEHQRQHKDMNPARLNARCPDQAVSVQRVASKGNQGSTDAVDRERCLPVELRVVLCHGLHRVCNADKCKQRFSGVLVARTSAKRSDPPGGDPLPSRSLGS